MPKLEVGGVELNHGDAMLTSSAYMWPRRVSSSWITVVTYNSLHVAVRSLSVTLRPWFRCPTPCSTMSTRVRSHSETLWPWFKCFRSSWIASIQNSSSVAVGNLFDGSSLSHWHDPSARVLLDLPLLSVTLVQMFCIQLDHVNPSLLLSPPFGTLLGLCDLGSNVSDPVGPCPFIASSVFAVRILSETLV